MRPLQDYLSAALKNSRYTTAHADPSFRESLASETAPVRSATMNRMELARNPKNPKVMMILADKGLRRCHLIFFSLIMGRSLLSAAYILIIAYSIFVYLAPPPRLTKLKRRTRL